MKHNLLYKIRKILITYCKINIIKYSKYFSKHDKSIFYVNIFVSNRINLNKNNAI